MEKLIREKNVKLETERAKTMKIYQYLSLLEKPLDENLRNNLDTR